MEGLDLKIRKGKRSRGVRVGGGSSSSSSGGASSSSSSSYESEEEAMANCLILLAQGRESHLHHKREGSVKGNGVGLYIYECKTCNRRFPSFQALGGHRASHKKPKVGAQPPPVTTGYDRFEECCDKINVKSGPQNKSNKVHECSICGSEFTSGQALGGHMRRHRASNNTVCNVTVTVAAPPRNILQLDLNLPPPPEDHLRDPNFLLLAAPPALVHCHY